MSVANYEGVILIIQSVQGSSWELDRGTWDGGSRMTKMNGAMLCWRQIKLQLL